MVALACLYITHSLIALRLLRVFVLRYLSRLQAPRNRRDGDLTAGCMLLLNDPPTKEPVNPLSSYFIHMFKELENTY